MTAEAFVKTKFPAACHQRLKKNNGQGYTIIWSQRYDGRRLGDGKTTAAAWASAARKLKEDEKALAT